MNRRDFLRATAAGAALALPGCSWAVGHGRRNPLPRWRGFNLLEKFNHDHPAPFRESDFQLISDWGFDFVRLPMSYRCWADPADVHRIREEQIADIDRAVEYGRKYGVHVNLNLHRIPGYCINPPAEPFDLWTDESAQEAATFHWGFLAERYRDVSADRLSFDIVNEPTRVDEPTYARVMGRIIQRIRQATPARTIIVDGLDAGRRPVPALAAAGVGQSTRGYDPMPVTHAGAGWVNNAGWPAPAWPLRLGNGELADKRWLRVHVIERFRAIERQGVGVHVGEWGVYNRTPHDVTLAFMRDYLELWREVGWGWALWNFRGEFGVLDSGRRDVAYEGFQGHALDRAMLDLLRAG